MGGGEGGGSRRTLAGVLVLLGLLLIATAALAATAMELRDGPSLHLFALLVLLIAGTGAVSAGLLLLGRHFDNLEKLRGALLVAAGRADALPADWPRLGEADAESRALGAAAARAIGAQRALGGRTDERLAAVVGATAEGLLVITENGLVSLVNAAGGTVLGREAVAVGTSVYAALERDDMAEIEHNVREAGAATAVELPHVDGRVIPAIMAPLGDHGGFVISLVHREPGTEKGVQHDLTLHDRPPQVSLEPGAEDGWPLEDLPVLVLDSETTGLDVAAARIVALGAVHGHGWRLYPHVNLDCLINPGVPIPRRSTAVHGITDAMASAAPPFAETWPRLHGMMTGAVVVGHSIGFDLAILEAECARHGIAWATPPALDTGLLFSALRPKETDFNLDRLAEQYGVEVEGRHTALGDALVTAEIWLALLPRLIERGVSTYGDARRFSAGASRMLVQQQKAGWVLAAGDAAGVETADG